MNEEQRVAMLAPWETNHEFVALEGLKHHNRFFTTNGKTHGDPRILHDGTVGYRILGYAETVEEAQMILYGRTYT